MPLIRPLYASIGEIYNRFASRYRRYSVLRNRRIRTVPVIDPFHRDGPLPPKGAPKTGIITRYYGSIEKVNKRRKSTFLSLVEWLDCVGIFADDDGTVVAYDHSCLRSSLLYPPFQDRYRYPLYLLAPSYYLPPTIYSIRSTHIISPSSNFRSQLGLIMT